MIRRSNTASGAYLLKRAERLARTVVPRYGKKTEFVDGYLVEGKRTGNIEVATVLDLPGELVSFGDAAGGAMERVYDAPTRDVFDPRIAVAEYYPFMQSSRDVIPRYHADEDGPADRHVLGEPPPVNLFPIRITEGAPVEGERGVYCCSLVTTNSTWPITDTAPVWLEVHYHRCGPADGRMGAIIHRSVLESLAPGYSVFPGAQWSVGPPQVQGVYMSWPHSDASEYQDGVVITTLMRRLSESPDDPEALSVNTASLTFYLDLKLGQVVWHSLYTFDNASHPAFVREVLPVMLDLQSPDGEQPPPTTNVWTWQEIARAGIEVVGDQIIVAFVVRARRPVWRYPVGGDLPYNVLVFRKFFALCTLTITPGSPPVDEFSNADCWCSATSPAMDLIPGADVAMMEASLNVPFLVSGQAYVSWYTLERPATDYAGHDYDTYGIVRYPDVERHYYGSTVWATAQATGLTSDWTDNGNSLQQADIAMIGHATRRSDPFQTRVSDDTVAFTMYRFDGSRMYTVIMATGASYVMIRPFAGYSATADAAQGKYGLTCPQREVRDKDGNVVTPYLLLAHAKATIDGVETPVVAIRYGSSPAWYRYQAGAYADRGVAYVGNPLMARPYGHLFEGQPA